MRKETLTTIVEELEQGKEPAFAAGDFPCFAEAARKGVVPSAEEAAHCVAASLTKADCAVFRRALAAVEAGETAWLAFKLVFDAEAAQRNIDNPVTPVYGETGSADGRPAVFFANEAGEVVASRPFSPRDEFQVLDVTRGPAMHTDQFDGLTWCAEALPGTVRVWLVGATDASAETAALASHVGFSVMAVDDSADFLNEERFPTAERILLDSYADLDGLAIKPGDYVCVLTRGHVHDPEACVWAVRHGAHYVGMMGCRSKNDNVKKVCLEAGMTEEEWESVKRPIGLKFGAKTPAELAIAIAAELVDVRYRQRTSARARAEHEEHLGR